MCIQSSYKKTDNLFFFCSCREFNTDWSTMLIVCIGVEIYEKYLYIYSTIYYVSRKEFQCLFCTERWPKTSNYCTSLASYFPASLTPIYLVDHSSCGKETYLSAQYACEPPRLYIMVCVFLLSCRHLSACLLFRFC